jgi:hypothetical protein
MDWKTKIEICWEFLKWLIEIAVIPSVAVFFGAYFAYVFSKKQKKEENKSKIRIQLQLIKDDVKKGQNLLKDVLNSWEEAKNNTVKEPTFFYMPVTYFKDVDYVQLGNYINKDCLEHIRNIHEYVFLAWNRRLEELSEMLDQKAEKSKIRMYMKYNLIAGLVSDKSDSNYIITCDNVIKAIESEIPKIK